MSVAEWLKGSLSHDSQIREASTQQLKSIYQNDFPQYIALLTQELVNTNNEQIVRSAAALAFKNALTAKEVSLKEEKLQKWASVEPTLKNQLKTAILQTLDSNIGAQSALCITAMASIDLPQNQWPELMLQLLNNITETKSSEQLKVNSLITMGYICEQIEPKVLVSQSNSILTAVANGARKEEPSLKVRRYALQALCNSLSFIRENFHKDEERNIIMQVVCEGTNESNTDIQLAAFECLNKIVDIYYPYMEVYMDRALIGITMQSMQSQEENIVLQAIEFWSTLCEREIKITDEETEALALGVSSKVTCLGFARKICKDLVPILFWFLTQQEEDMDEDEWSPCMAASTCLTLLSQCVGPEIVNYALKLIDPHLRNSDWHYREAAVMLFGCILEVPSSKELILVVETALPFILNLTQDPQVSIRDTSFWTLGRICEFVIQDLKPQWYEGIITALVRGLTEASDVSMSSCWALMLFAEAMGSSDPHTDTNVISPFFELVVSALMQLSARDDVKKTTRTSAYEALAAWIIATANDTVPKLNFVAQEILRRFELTLANTTTLFSESVQELVSNFITVLSSLIRRLNKDIAPAADTLMQLLFRILELTTLPKDPTLATSSSSSPSSSAVPVTAPSSSSPSSSTSPTTTSAPTPSSASPMLPSSSSTSSASSSSSNPTTTTTLGTNPTTSSSSPSINPFIQEDVFLCIGNMANALERSFQRYSDPLVPFLVQALSYHEDHALCTVAVGVVADMARSLEELFFPYAQGFMEVLGNHLIDPQLHISVKLAILTCFGDIALAIGGPAFEPYLPAVMHVLIQVCTVPEFVPSMEGYMDSIRESTIEALVGIVQAFSSCQKLSSISPWIQFILGLMYSSVHNQVNPDHHSRNVAGLLGDLASGLGSEAKEAFMQPWVEQFLARLTSTHMYSASTVDTAKWARERIRAM